MALHKKQVTYSSKPSHAARAAHAKGDKEFRKYDTSAIMPKHDPKPVIVAAVVALVVVAAVAFFAVRSCSAASDLLGPDQTVNVEIVEGESAQSIGDTLAKAHLIGSAQDFVGEVTRLEAASALIPGVYTFHGGMTSEEIVRAIMVGPSSTGNSLTVPEGLTRQATAGAVAEATGGRISAEDFMAASADASVYAKDYPFLETAGKNSLEGFLFPKTYTVTADVDAQALVRLMLDQFKEETLTLPLEYPESQGLNFYQTVTLASIVEKESSEDQDIRNQVASVFYNRLASDRPYLESDATTAYEVGHDPTGEEVHADTAYSTYTHEGLPPTPICSPSLSCLKAVCEPAKTDYLFFYFKPNDDGTMKYTFSKTYEEHQKAIG